ncbi:class I SAM-dependent methyltransferase [Paenibacillus thiaminolyticus]|uniref:class I SAM-dependent methyltransferase n=1 Tax=Paenibacillus thiaminolyticus TaxID=49283 RepID=UPI00234FBD85|nr:class I SAM-dependent methyltransferase [Paenibacillus thiaminolyticus]WCR28287.1 class I SAM-dependent methyltransferase [Paenibacillus thiaminolyticus]
MLTSLEHIRMYREGRDDPALLSDNRWLQYIVTAEERIVNLERIQSLQQLANSNPVLDYVERTLQVLDGLPLSFWIKETIEEVLKWSETAKGGSVRQRIAWQEQGISLFAHNVGSAQLYGQHTRNQRQERVLLTHTLIFTHGLIGQYWRGEVPLAENAPLYHLIERGIVSAQEMRDLLLPLNQCIIGAVSPELWDAVKADTKLVIDQIVGGRFAEGFTLPERIRRLRAMSERRGENTEAELRKLAEQPRALDSLRALEPKTLWYVEAALHECTFEEFVKIFLLGLAAPEMGAHIRHISFERLMNGMYYDYRGRKHLNVYKKRMIEQALRSLTYDDIANGAKPDSPHLDLRIERADGMADSVYVDFVFSPAAEKLIEFCIEAEKTPLYERAILMLFDLFELRRDAYDRFHNEEAYLSDMNGSADYKQVILDYVTGSRVIDIGPGGGVMLDLLEERLPEAEAIGIDISQNVVEALERKKQLENRRWRVMKGDALDLKRFVAPQSIDTVIFSSILHELYSYIEYEGQRFNPKTIAAALRSAFDVLSPGGRIIIRDGIMSEPEGQMRIIRFRNADGLPWLERYAKDFAGRRISVERLSPFEAKLPINDAMEFLYTYTWGPEAYVHEVQEQFGYFTPTQYAEFIQRTLGGRAAILRCDHYLQDGYTEALAPKISLLHEHGEPVRLPDSTCLIVIEKR